MWKVVVGLLALAITLSAIFMAHAVATGILIPYPDPTPQLAAYERFHRQISNPLLLTAVVAWLVAGVAVAVCAGRWWLRGSRAEPVQVDRNSA